MLIMAEDKKKSDADMDMNYGKIEHYAWLLALERVTPSGWCSAA